MRLETFMGNRSVLADWEPFGLGEVLRWQPDEQTYRVYYYTGTMGADVQVWPPRW
jgi:hypothetical protein